MTAMDSAGLGSQKPSGSVQCGAGDCQAGQLSGTGESLGNQGQNLKEIPKNYPLVNVYITMEHHHF